jgi:hypothetical protein
VVALPAGRATGRATRPPPPKLKNSLKAADSCSISLDPGRWVTYSRRLDHVDHCHDQRRPVRAVATGNGGNMNTLGIRTDNMAQSVVPVGTTGRADA